MANTDFKIVDHLAAYPTSQYNFTFPANFKPLNEQQTAAMKMDRDAYPYINLNYFSDYGLADRPITLQGPDLDNDDKFALRAAIENPRIKQLFLGDDYYYYVRGLEARLIRDVNKPLLYLYTAAFLAVDHYMYDNAALDSVQIDGSDDLVIDTAGGNLGGKVYVEPIFWVDDLSGATLTFTDDRGCRLTFTPPDDDVWIILPWYNYKVSGFLPDNPIAFKAQSWAVGTVTTNWALDAKVEGASKQFLKTSGNYIGGGSVLTLTDTNTPKIYKNTPLYPRAEPGRSTTIAVGGEGGETGVYAQWRLRK